MARMAGVDAVETRNRILEVAEDLFAGKGFDATGIDEIAKSAEITKSVIYYHFKNKDDIRTTLIRRFIDEIMDLKRQRSVEFVQGEVSIDDSIIGMIDFFKEHEKTVRILMMQSMTDSSRNPLLNLWDQNIGIARQYRQILFGEPFEEHAKDNFLDVYFLALVPLLSYFAFADNWCAHYGLERTEADRIFARSLETMYAKFMLPEYGIDVDKEG